MKYVVDEDIILPHFHWYFVVVVPSGGLSGVMYGVTKALHTRCIPLHLILLVACKSRFRKSIRTCLAANIRPSTADFECHSKSTPM